MRFNERILEARGRERPDYTAFNAPDATLSAGSTEEIEFDQALSLAGRFGRDFLGINVMDVLQEMATEFLTISTADHQMELICSIATRTGVFNLPDPELIWRKLYSSAVTAPTTATSESLNPNIDETLYGEPFLYVAPRLFWRMQNDLDASLAISDVNIRFASVSVKLTFPLFIELLERFADVTLL